MLNWKRIALGATIPLAIGGWYVFRPELLFINKTVDEKIAVSANETKSVLSMGSFESYAHETRGEARLVRVGDKSYLELTNFHTSNGPDVRVKLVKGKNPADGGASDGFLDLGSIKGTDGNQFYELPAGTNPNDFESVSIWCERFSVGFGGATLKPEPKVGYVSDGFQLAGNEIVVTDGKLAGSVAGHVRLIENSGKRYVRIEGLKGNFAGLQVRLLKAESPKAADVAKATHDVLGTLKPSSATQTFAADKSRDVWLYRSISLWNAKAGRSEAIALLRSKQERDRGNDLFLL